MRSREKDEMSLTDKHSRKCNNQFDGDNVHVFPNTFTLDADWQAAVLW